MNGKVLAGICVGAIVVGGLWLVQMDQWNLTSRFSKRPRQLVYVGDTQDRVDKLLGSPNIEFPKEESLVRWYAGYEITLRSNVVTAVKIKPVESEEERLEKEHRAKLAEEQLKTAYGAMAKKEKISYNAWLDREEKRLQAEREERAKVQAYEQRKSEEKKASIYAESIRKSCGCYDRHCRHYHH
jgi:hypothetical protein